MANEQTASVAITPILSKDVSFTEKVNEVDGALKSRAAAQKAIKLKWTAVVKVLIKANMSVPSRRPSADVAANMVASVRIYEPRDPRLNDKKKMGLANKAVYQLSQLLAHQSVRKELKEKFTGFEEWAEELFELNRLANENVEVNEEATAVAKADLQTAVDAYIQALEDYDETVETVTNVKEYIAVVKDVAEIAAIAQGKNNG